ncbi:maltotransferase domain-containing protein, partial [Kitasatospora sp. NPDC097691]|uniref:maltotransferase domain-containing protein n=1 Tax=Kitasatospora sp. NPDC097691 TaxID=3157231 RepID=UPI003322E3E1
MPAPRASGAVRTGSSESQPPAAPPSAARSSEATRQPGAEEDRTAAPRRRTTTRRTTASAATPKADAGAESAPRRTTAARKAAAPKATAAKTAAAPAAERAAKPARKQAARPSARKTESDTVIGRIPVLDVSPLVDAGRRPAKAVAGETFLVTATVFREGHDAVNANVVLRDPRGRSGPWTPMRELAEGTDRWGAHVTPTAPGRWSYLVEAWSDPIATWRKAAAVKLPAGIDTALVLEEG